MRFLVLAVMCVACGDNTTRDVPFDAVSGTRLRVERYMFDDGTSVPGGPGFFDAELHVRCTPQTYLDGTVRCVPDAEDALFSDAGCTTAIGRGMTIMDPTYFVGHDVKAGASLPSHVYRAGQPTAAPGQYWQRIDDTCAGPFFTPSDYVYYQLTGEVDVVELRDTIVGEGRLELRVRTSTDGAITPLALFDRDLVADCEPAERADGTAACEPVSAPAATLFADATCATPAVAIADSPSPPLVARLESDGDCPTYHVLGAELTTTLYRTTGTACVPVARVPSAHYYTLGDEAALPAIEREVEPSAHRLHRIIAATDDLVAYGTHLVDNAIRGECARAMLGEVQRCVPTSTIAATDVYAAGCVQRLPITEVPVRSCHAPAFAVTFGDAVAISAIGDITTQTVYRFATDGTCKPYTPPADRPLHTLGPPLPDDTFLAARPYGER
jgi:hypothetical protein